MLAVPVELDVMYDGCVTLTPPGLNSRRSEDTVARTDSQSVQTYNVLFTLIIKFLPGPCHQRGVGI